MSGKPDMGTSGCRNGEEPPICETLRIYSLKPAREMKNRIFKYSLKIIGVLIALFVIAIALYKIFVFPGEIRKDCAYEALDYVAKKEQATNHYVVQERDADYEFMYKFCLNKNGLKANR